MMGANASGQKLPPLIIFKGKNMWDTWMADEAHTFPGTSYAATSNRWMEMDVFTNYFRNVFLSNCVEERPILLIFDGHKTHLDPNLINMAILNNVVILKLPRHTSHTLQPLDLSVFKSLKTRWDNKLTTFQRTHMGQKIPKHEFSDIVCSIWKETNPEIIKSGFHKGGIYPLNNQAVDVSKFEPDA